MLILARNLQMSSPGYEQTGVFHALAQRPRATDGTASQFQDSGTGSREPTAAMLSAPSPRLGYRTVWFELAMKGRQAAGYPRHPPSQRLEVSKVVGKAFGRSAVQKEPGRHFGHWDPGDRAALNQVGAR